MKVWVDADACPGAVKEIILKTAKRLNLETVFVANKELQLPPLACVSFVRVDGSSDAADSYIAEHSEAGDLAVTQDIPLASILVGKETAVVNPHGQEFTADNITERLSLRNFMQEMRDSGQVTGGPKPFSDKEKRAFADTYDRIITRLKRRIEKS